MSGTLDFGRYTIQRELGRGGMATVYHARDTQFKRDVALKVLPREFLHDQSFLYRFEQEAQTIADLQHPAIVPLYDFGVQDGQPFMVIGYMEGGSLADRIADGSLTSDQVFAVIERVAQALDAAHAAGIIHRDVKPANILFDKHGFAYLSDFGIVKLAESTDRMSGSGIVGTAGYIAPEMMDEGGFRNWSMFMR